MLIKSDAKVLEEFKNQQKISKKLCALSYAGKTAIYTEERYEQLINHEAFIKGSKHFTYVFRHSLLLHEDGSLSLNELLNHRGTQIKMRQMRSHGPTTMSRVDKSLVKNKSRHSAIEFLLPLAHAICNSNKERVQIGYMEVGNFLPGTTPPVESYFSPAEFTAKELRESQADHVEALDVASIFIRFESGHSNETVATHPLFNSDEFPNNYLLHGTSERNLNSIRQMDYCQEEHAALARMCISHSTLL